MDISERLKMLPPDGSMKIVTERKDYKSNIMIIRCPEELRSPSDPEYRMAIVDRNVMGTNYSGNSILDKLCPGLPKVTIPKVEQPAINPPPLEMLTDKLDGFHFTSREDYFAPRNRGRSFRNNFRIARGGRKNDKTRAERNDKSWLERSWKERNDKPRIDRSDKTRIDRSDKSRIDRSDKSRIDRSDKSWTEWPKRCNVDDISPWEEGKQPWNNPLGNIQIPLFNGNIPMNIDYHEVANRLVTTAVPVVHCTPPTFPTQKGLLGDHPFESKPFLSVPKELDMSNDDRNQTRTGGCDNWSQTRSEGSDNWNLTKTVSGDNRNHPRTRVGNWNQTMTEGNDNRNLTRAASGDNLNRARTGSGDNRNHVRTGSGDNRNHVRTGSGDNRNHVRTGSGDNRNQTRTRGNGNNRIQRKFQINKNFKRKPFVNKASFQMDERNSEESLWNVDEGERLNNRTRGQNRNRRGKSFERGRAAYRGRSNYY